MGEEVVFLRENVSASALPATSTKAIKQKHGTNKEMCLPDVFFIVPCAKLEQAQGEFLI